MGYQRQVVLGLTAVMVCCLPGVNAAASTSLDRDLRSHVGKWEQSGKVWSTRGEEPPSGWYLRSARQYNIDRLAWRMRKRQADGIIFLHTTNWQVVFCRDMVHVKYMAPDPQVNFRHKYWYWYKCTRDLDFPAGQWQHVEFVLDGEALRIIWNDEEVLAFSSPREEWQARVAASGKMLNQQLRFPERIPAPVPVHDQWGVRSIDGHMYHPAASDAIEEQWAQKPLEDRYLEIPLPTDIALNEPNPLAGLEEVVILQAYRTEADFRDIRLQGSDVGEAEGFVSEPPLYGMDTIPDYTLQRLAPLEPVDISWNLPSEEAAMASELPPVLSWKLDRDDMVDPAEIWGTKHDDPREMVTYRLGAEEPGHFPFHLLNYLRSYIWGRGNRNLPQEVRLFFNLKEGGVYTLKCDLGDRIGSGPNTFLVRVDGKPVSREVYRNLARRYPSCPIYDYIPLKLSAGPHRIDFRLSMDLIDTFGARTKYMKVPFVSLELAPGVSQPLFTRHVDQPPSAAALQDGPEIGEQYGKIIQYRLRGLEPGTSYALTLKWWEANVPEAGLRLMDLYLNGDQVEEALDVFGEAGGRFKLLTRRYDVSADEQGELEVKLVGRNFKAFVNYMHLSAPDGQTVYEENLGWTSWISKKRGPKTYTPHIRETAREMPVPGEKRGAFVGHNLVANPDFADADEKTGKPAYWYSIFDFNEERKHGSLFFYDLLAGQGAYRHDKEVGHEQAGALRIGKTDQDFAVMGVWPRINYHKLQKFSFWVKTDKADGDVFAELVWFAQDGQLTGLKWMVFGGYPKALPRLRMLGRTTGGQKITGTSPGWRKVEVCARPPRNAHWVMPLIRVSGNTRGTVWVDDALFTPYGAEPLEISYPHMGFHPRGGKRFVVKSFHKAPVTWKLVDADTGNPVRNGRCDYHSFDGLAGRHYYITDLEDFRSAGMYRFVATQKTVARKTEPFVIRGDIYRQLTGKTLNAIHTERYNDFVDGVHFPYALDHSHVSVKVNLPRFELYESVYDGEYIEIIGGYDDASNEIKYTQFWPVVMLGAYNAWQYLEPFSERTENDALDEMRWVYGSLYKHMRDDGAILRGVKPRARINDGVPMYGVESWAYGPSTNAQAAGAMAMGAWVLRDIDPELAAINREAAIRNYQYNHKILGERYRESKRSSGERMLYASKFLFAEMYLLKLTGEDLYRKRLERHLDDLIAGLRERGYAGAIELFRGNFQDGGITQDFTTVGCHFAKLYPRHARMDDLKTGLRAFAEDVAKVSDVQAYGQALTITPEGEPGVFARVERMVGYWPGLARSLAEIGVLLEEPRFILLAERQLQWCLGRNFTDMSIVHGTSERVPAVGDGNFCRALFMANWLDSDRVLYTYDGIVPSQSFRDVKDGNVSLRSGDISWPPVSGGPLGYCAHYAQSTYHMDQGPSEVYLPHTGLMLNAAAAVHAGLEWLSRQ